MLILPLIDLLALTPIYRPTCLSYLNESSAIAAVASVSPSFTTTMRIQPRDQDKLILHQVVA
jgi:hypothetical protein